MKLREEHIAELRRIASVLNEWAAELPIRRVLVFGSRVRGDHRPDSDLDLAIEPFRDADYAALPDHGDSLLERWVREEEEEWSGLQRALGFPPRRLVDDDEPIWKLIRAAAARPVLVADRVTFVLLPPARCPVRGKDSPVG